MADSRRARGGQGKRLAAVPSDAGKVQGDTVERARAKHYGEQLLRMAAAGTTVAQGARHLEISETSAKRYFAAALDEVHGLTDEEKRELVRIDLETIRLLIQSHMPRAMKGSIGSAQVVLAGMRERSMRLGLDEALQVAISNSAIADAVEDVIDMVENAAPIELPPLPALPPMPGDTPAPETEDEVG